jgi:glycerophosphoryl diester phosphodiesterase
MGASLPKRIPGLLARAGANALTLHHSITSEEAIATAHDLGAPVYVWTVDDPERARTLAAWGADGIITNDPRVFTGLTT